MPLSRRALLQALVAASAGLPACLAAREPPRDVVLCLRDPTGGLLGKRTTAAPGRDLLDFFDEAWSGSGLVGPVDWVRRECGGDVPDLEGFLASAGARSATPPQGRRDLDNTLRLHLAIPGGHDHIRLDDHHLRVRTDDGELELAWYLYERAWARRNRDRTAWLEQQWPLPDDAGSSSHVPDLPSRPLLPAGDGDGVVWACLGTFYDSGNLQLEGPFRFDGLRLPELAAHLLRVTPRATDWAPGPARSEATWPLELRLLRALLEPGEATLEPALRRCNHFPVFAVGAETRQRELGNGSRRDAQEAFEEAGKRLRRTGDPRASRLRVAPHLAQLAMHATETLGYQQWFLFDDLWAGAHRDLADSMLRWFGSWDPLGS